jgi:hypothetical protein
MEAEMVGPNRTRVVALPLLIVTALVGLLAAGAQGAIRINVARGQFQFHARVGPTTGPQVPADGLIIELSNVNGEITQFAVPAGGCVDHGGRSCSYRNPAITPAGGTGVASFRMNYASGRMWMTAYGDLSKATTPVMTIDVELATSPPQNVGELTATFAKTATGWILSDRKGTW